MRCLGILACIALIAAGCADYNGGDGKGTYQAPILSSDTSDVLDLRGNIDFGTNLQDNFSTSKALTGYVFDANQGARVTLTLTSNNGEDPVLVLYGPMDRRGVWGEHLALDDDGKDGRNSLIRDLALPGSGRYLIALATFDGSAGGPFDLLLGCRGACSEPHCPDVTCGMYCPNGYMTDADGCFTCMCSEPQCQSDEDCLIYPWTDAMPRCIDGQCVYDEMECEVNQDCPEGYECVAWVNCWDDEDGTGTCETFGYCQPVVEPECVEDSDCIFEDGTAGRCIEGRCVPDAMECQSDADCPDGYVCEEICWDCDPEDPDCLPGCEGVCVPEEPPQCQSDADCPDGHTCVTECWDVICEEGAPDCPPECDPATGICEPVCFSYCVPIEQECRVDTDCISEDGQMGMCVDGRCVFDPWYCSADWDCPPGFTCEIVECGPDCDPTNPDCCYGICVPDNQPECQVDEDCILPTPDGTTITGQCIEGRCVFDECICPEIWSPVCGEICYSIPDCFPGDPDCEEFCSQETFPNECYAECQGARVLYPGECEDQPPPMCEVDSDCPPGFVCVVECWSCDDPDDPDCLEPICEGYCLPEQTEECMVTGCNGEVCAPHPVDTSCVWLPEYECLRYTTCQMLESPDGQRTCGWVQNDLYWQCLEQIQNPDVCVDDSDCPPGTICQTFCIEDYCESACYPVDCECPDVFDPVCGADGNTYDNICQAACVGVEMLHPGPC